MDGTNRFAPPVARVADVAVEAADFQQVRLWPPRGRMGRLRFLAYGVGLYLGLILITFVLGVVAALTRAGPTIAIVVGMALYFFGILVLLVQRSHDMNLSGWWSLVAFIPLVGLLWVFGPGSKGANRWGAPPPPNGLAVKIVGLFFPILGLIGIAAAIALPAYQAYALRAQAGAVR
jgi:uncharacterized membrane protein YhaH (DUF805 family)